MPTITTLTFRSAPGLPAMTSTGRCCGRATPTAVTSLADELGLQDGGLDGAILQDQRSLPGQSHRWIQVEHTQEAAT
jgi:hypothetical protein